MRHAIITGGAGFIGSHLVDRLLAEGGWRVTVIDNFDPFYPRALKEANIATHLKHPDFRFMEGDILDDVVLDQAFAEKGAVVIHIAAKAGVRPSIADPIGYHRVNVTGTLKLLERARYSAVEHFILASSSSVYGVDPNVPWKEKERGIQPISPYAASKLAAEGFAQVYAHLHGMKVTALRFFTVYGPRQRPDLAIHQFFRKILSGTPIQQFGDGSTRRDYTFVDDIISGVRGAIDRRQGGPFGIYNLGNSDTIMLRDLIGAIEHETGRKAIIERKPEQPGDVPQTFADVSKAGAHFGYTPTTSIREGLKRFHGWIVQEAGVMP
ncbi:MAG: GDP-mannose 4,6-dehydratase [Flavobacteriales bacterium]|nr:GDP-mannose 4,6-dehydratase [Flavobacteriales bacterium]